MILTKGKIQQGCPHMHHLRYCRHRYGVSHIIYPVTLGQGINHKPLHHCRVDKMQKGRRELRSTSPMDPPVGPKTKALTVAKSASQHNSKQSIRLELNLNL